MTNLINEGRNISDLFDNEGEAVISLAGEVSMEVPVTWGLRLFKALKGFRTFLDLSTE